jgi:uncharacterized membrane protein YqiK
MNPLLVTGLIILGSIVGVIIAIKLLLMLLGIRIIGSNEVAIVEKWWSGKGSLKEEIIALNGEAGYQPEVLRGGVHFLTPFMYKVHAVPLVTIPQGQIGYVFARDGKPLEPTQTLGKLVPECNNFQDVRAFIENGGQKGPQRGIIREGTYVFNLAQFIIITKEKAYFLPLGTKAEEATINKMVDIISEREGFEPVIISGSNDKLGIVTVHDGPSLSKDDLVAPIVGDDKNKPEGYHNNFQDIEKFLIAGGYRGKQHQVLVDGTYFINRLFATVEYKDKTLIDVGFVGVVNSFIGSKGVDISGDDFKHGELVAEGCKGVWSRALPSGKYAFNIYAGVIAKVPITNIILSWKSGETGIHKLDTNLREVSIITKDAFEPSLPLSIAIHIDYKKAPLVIQRFGTVQNLVDQALDILVSSYFKNVAQTKTLIELIQQRSDIQKQASAEMRERFDHYNLELEEVLIGTPTSSAKDNRIETILAQLRDRQLATEQIETYQKQQAAAEQEKKLKEAIAKAEQQTSITQSELNIQIQSNQGKAEYEKSVQDAEKMKAMAAGEAAKTEVAAQAEAKKQVYLAESNAKQQVLAAEAEANKVKLSAAAEAEATKVKALAEAERVNLTAAAEANKTKLVAAAEAERIKLIADSEAEKEEKVGIAKAVALKKQVDAYGGAQLKVMQEVLSSFADAIKEGGAPLVPSTVVNMGNGGENTNALDAIFRLTALEKLGINTTDFTKAAAGKETVESQDAIQNQKVAQK